MSLSTLGLAAGAAPAVEPVDVAVATGHRIRYRERTEIDSWPESLPDAPVPQPIDLVK